MLRAASGQSPAAVLALLSGSVGEAVAKASSYAGRALSENTRRAYATDWALFSAWCEAGSVVPLPAEPMVVAGYLASLAGQLGRSGLRRRLATIAEMHRRTGHPFEPGHPVIRTTLRGILADHGTPARPAAALTSAEVKRLLATCGTDLAGLRDKALLVGFAGALRRSELVAIDREELRFTSEGMTVRIPRSKRDQEGEGATVGIPRGLNPLTCPVRATEEWLRNVLVVTPLVADRMVGSGSGSDTPSMSTLAKGREDRCRLHPLSRIGCSLPSRSCGPRRR